MTGFELVSKFYSANLSYLKHHPTDKDFDRIPIVLFLLGLIETAYISGPNNIHPTITEFLNVNQKTN